MIDYALKDVGCFIDDNDILQPSSKVSILEARCHNRRIIDFRSQLYINSTNNPLEFPPLAVTGTESRRGFRRKAEETCFSARETITNLPRKT
ncbi:hypothetical protein WA026_001263 [Henosepilachna vigintioctopunctata]|uniref:Uncharacterized protein n=1 Tax=Henosepilachna vigintioctopunctata TaxID=420089 RepID=A0AAW1URH6_9CUCU